ncbi:MAG: DUF885 family protein, partial [Candidatus Fermentibacteria bacterium]
MKSLRFGLLFLVFSVAFVAGCTSADTPTLETIIPITETSPEDQAPPIATIESEPQIEPTSPEVEEGPTPISVEATRWGDLSFDEFIEESYREIMLRNPELLVEMGLSDDFGVEEVLLTDISDDYIQETYDLYAEIEDALQSYDRAALTPEQQLDYDIYSYYLDDNIRGREFLYADYPIVHFLVGKQYELLYFFTDLHPVTDVQEAETYITRLSQVDTKVGQLIEGLILREQAGVIAPRFILDWSLPEIQGHATRPATVSPYYRSLSEKLSELDISSDERSALLDAAATAIDESVAPAYKELADYIEELARRAPNQVGIWQHPNGPAYYEYLVRHYTTTDLTPDEIHQLGMENLEQIHAEMREIFDQLGYPADESLPE